MLKASKSIKNIIGVSELTQDEYNTNSMNVIVELKKHFKILNIMMAVFLGLGLIGSIAFAATLPALINEIRKSNPSMMDNPYSNPALSNPYQTQSNKSQTAGQMGMTDKEHAEMHDPKNIVNTDYSQLDYSNAGEELKASQNAVKKSLDSLSPEQRKQYMDSLTPEQKASIEKMLNEIKN